jgi:protein-disulfide isomerase
MTKRDSMLLLFVALGLAGCPKAAEPVRADSAANTAPGIQAQKANKLRLPADTVVAKWTGGQLTYGEFIEKRKKTFDRLDREQQLARFKAEEQELESYLAEMVVQEAAKAKNQTEEQYIEGLNKTGNLVTDADIQAFYDQNVKPRPDAPPFEMIKERIQGFLVSQKSGEVVRNEIERLKKEKGLSTELPAPEVAKVSFDLAGRPMKGNPNAKVTVVEFSDFQCPYCARAKEAVDELVKAYPNDVKVYFLHFPLSFHEQALPAAVAAQCANKQGKFWELHDKIFDNQRALAVDQLMGWAKDVGLDVAAFETCMKDPEAEKMVRADMEQGEAAGVQGTPSFYVNGVPHQNGPPTAADIAPLVKGS